MNKEFFVNNRQRLISEFEDNSMLILFSGNAPYWSGDQVYTFSVDKNFYYVTGLEEEDSLYVLIKDNNTVKETIFIQKDYEDKFVKFLGHRKDKDYVTNLTNITDVRYIDDLDSFFDSIDSIKLKNIFMGANYEFEERLEIKIEDIFYKSNFMELNELFSKYRAIKQKFEVENIKKAIEITGMGIVNMFKNAKGCEYEYELEAFYDFEIKKNGIKDKAFETIVASEKNATTLHYTSNNSKIEDNALVLIDLGARFEQYCADISRTFPISGRFTERQKTLYNIVLKAQKDTMNGIKIGMTFKDLNDITRKSLIESCKAINLVENDVDINKYYYHSVSHPLGLDAHDCRENIKSIEPGMVITMEPGLYIAEEKIGIRIEDDVLVTEDGYINLSEGIPKAVEEIEKIMSR